MEDRSASNTSGENRRRYGRLVVDDLKCSVGRIVNISAGGMVVVGRCSAHKVDVVIGGKANQVVITAVRVWAKRYGFSRRMVAYRFVEPPPNLLQLINGAQLPTNVIRVI